MAHFAKLNENNIVLSVHAVDDVNVPTEQDGINFLKKSMVGKNGNKLLTALAIINIIHMQLMVLFLCLRIKQKLLEETMQE